MLRIQKKKESGKQTHSPYTTRGKIGTKDDQLVERRLVNNLNGKRKESDTLTVG